MAFIKAIARWLGCFLLLSGISKEEEISRPDERYLDAVTRAFESEVQMRFNLICDKSGASMPEDIETIDIGFWSPKKTSIEKARILGVQLMELFLKRINADEQLRPYLREYPFTADRVFLTLSFYDPEKPYYTDSPGYVSFVNNRVIYKLIGEDYKYTPILEEPYKEAVAIVHKSQGTQ